MAALAHVIPYAATVFVSVLVGSYLQRYSMEKRARLAAKAKP